MEEIKDNNRTLYVLHGLSEYVGNDFLGVFDNERVAIEHFEYIRRYYNPGFYSTYKITKTILNDPE